MSQKRLQDDMCYHAALSMAKAMREKGLITEEEFAEIDTRLLKKYKPYMGTLLSKNTCYLLNIEHI